MAAADAAARGFRAAEVSGDRGENEPPAANISLTRVGASPPLSAQTHKVEGEEPPTRQQKGRPSTSPPLCLTLSPLHEADDAERRGSGGPQRGSSWGAPSPPLLRGGGLSRGLTGPLGATRGPPSASSVYLLLAEAPEAVRELWSASFEVKRLGKRHFVLQADLRVVVSWVFDLLNDDSAFSSAEGLEDQARFAAAVAVYGQLLPQLIWAVAVAASSLGTLTLQETRTLWARLQLLALDATSSSSSSSTTAAAAAGGSRRKAKGGLGPSSAFFGPSRAFGRRKRRRSQHQKQQQQQHEALDAAAGSSAEPELLLQELSQRREALSLRDGNEPRASAVLSKLLNDFEGVGEAPSLRPSPVSSPFAELRRDLLQLGALRSPGGGLVGASTAGSSTTSLALAQSSEPATTAAAAAAAIGGSSNDGFGGPDRWMLMPWQSAAAAAAAALQQGLSRRSSFSSVASELLPTGQQQQQQQQELLLQGPLAIEVPVGAAVDPAVASPFRLLQQQRRPLPPSEPSSVGSAGSKRTVASSAAVGTPDGRWAPELLQDMDLGDWELPGEDPLFWQQAAVTPAATAAAAAEGGGSGEEQVALAIPEALPLAAKGGLKKRRQQQQKVQLDAILCRSQVSAAEAAARSEAEGAAASAAAKAAAAAALRLLEAGTEDADTLKSSLRCYRGVLHRQLSLRAPLLQQQQQQQQQRLLTKRFGGPSSGAAQEHSEGALLACSLLCGLLAPVLPSSVKASAAALRGLCQGDSGVRAAIEQQQLLLQQLQRKQQPQQAAAGGAAAAAEGEALGGAGLRTLPAGLEGEQEAAADAAAAAAAAVASRRRRSSWLERENVLKGFGSPLRVGEFSEGGGGDEADTWEDSAWGGALDDGQPQQQQQQQQQQQLLLQPFACENTFNQAFAEEGRLAGVHGVVPPAEGSPGAPPQGAPRLCRNKDGAAISLWPSAASLLELVERASRPPGAGIDGTAPPSGVLGPPDLAHLLEGHSRRTAARAFRDALSLHSLGLCMLKQETAEEGLTQPGSLGGAKPYPPLVILSQGEAAREAAATKAAGSQPAAAAAAAATAAVTSTSAEGSNQGPVAPAGGQNAEARVPEPVSPPMAAAAAASGDGDKEAFFSPLTRLQQRPAAELVREQAAAVAAAAAGAAAAEAEETGAAPITDEQLEQAVQWLVTGLLDRLQEQRRLHAHQLVHWFVHELLPRSAFAGIASPKAWEAKAVYAVCTLIDEGVFAASGAAVSEAPVNLTVSCHTLQGDTELLSCPFWLEGVADAD